MSSRNFESDKKMLFGLVRSLHSREISDNGEHKMFDLKLWRISIFGKKCLNNTSFGNQKYLEQSNFNQFIFVVFSHLQTLFVSVCHPVSLSVSLSLTLSVSLSVSLSLSLSHSRCLILSLSVSLSLYFTLSSHSLIILKKVALNGTNNLKTWSWLKLIQLKKILSSKFC